MWDSNHLLACCTVPIGYHPSVYGDYLDARVPLDQITGINAVAIDAEFDASSPVYASSASSQLDISALVASELAFAAEKRFGLAIRCQNPVVSRAAVHSVRRTLQRQDNGVATLALVEVNPRPRVL